jgi:hypothetical protein
LFQAVSTSQTDSQFQDRENQETDDDDDNTPHPRLTNGVFLAGQSSQATS